MRKTFRGRVSKIPDNYTGVVSILSGYYEALVCLDELSLQLWDALGRMRVDWSKNNPEYAECLNSLNSVADRIGLAIPFSIRATRPSRAQEKREQELKGGK